MIATPFALLVLKDLNVNDESLRTEFIVLVRYCIDFVKTDMKTIHSDSGIEISFNAIYFWGNKNNRVFTFAPIIPSYIDPFLKFRLNRVYFELTQDFNKKLNSWLEKVAKSEKIW